MRWLRAARPAGGAAGEPAAGSSAGPVAILSVAILALAGAALAASPARTHSGSDAEQRACTPDVFRLCMASIPDEDAIVACLRSKRPLLSPACAEVFSEGIGATRGRKGQ